jgi:hypothetical protein
MAIFSDGFESGDFTAWTDTLEQGTATIDVVNTWAHHGTYGVEAILPNYAWAICRKTFAAAQTVYARFYMRVTSESLASSTYTALFSIGPSFGSEITWVSVKENGAGLLWSLVYGTGPYTHVDAASGPAVGTVYCVEIAGYRHASVGWVKLYVDGVEKCNATGLNLGGDNYTFVEAGPWGETESQTIHLDFDCVVVDSAYIGTEAAGVTVKKGSNLAATMTEMLNSKMLFSACNRFPKLTTRRF